VQIWGAQLIHALEKFAPFAQELVLSSFATTPCVFAIVLKVRFNTKRERDHGFGSSSNVRGWWALLLSWWSLSAKPFSFQWSFCLWRSDAHLATPLCDVLILRVFIWIWNHLGRSNAHLATPLCYVLILRVFFELESTQLGIWQFCWSHCSVLNFQKYYLNLERLGHVCSSIRGSWMGSFGSMVMK
jgi:hypothetical protein